MNVQYIVIVSCIKSITQMDHSLQLILFTTNYPKKNLFGRLFTVATKKIKKTQNFIHCHLYPIGSCKGMKLVFIV
jgi:hypothetical protein